MQINLYDSKCNFTLCFPKNNSTEKIENTLQWRYNERDGVWNHRRLVCLLNRLFRRGSKKTSKLHVTGLYEGNPPVTGEFPPQRDITRKMFPFDDVIMVPACGPFY